ncbi:hypothetical protein KKB83_02445, partial [Patescibacteria group bacterium]|nr:hypothetical protein [Patescibacteria group bacterium]
AVDFGVIAKSLPCSLMCGLAFAWIIVKSGKIQITKVKYLLLGSACCIVSQLGSVLHELGHIWTAEFFGLKVVEYSSSVFGFRVHIESAIFDAEPVVVIVTALMGPSVSAMIAWFSALALKHVKSRLVQIIVLYSYLMAMGNAVWSLFLPFAGDCKNFVQGAARYLNIELEYFATMWVILATAVIWLTIAKASKEIQKV